MNCYMLFVACCFCKCPIAQPKTESVCNAQKSHGKDHMNDPWFVCALVLCCRRCSMPCNSVLTWRLVGRVVA